MALRVDQNKVFQRVGYAPHPGQVALHNAKQKHRFRVATMGRRTGKSTAGGHELTTAAHLAYAQQASLEPKGKRHEYWIVGPEYSDSEKEFRVVYNDVLKLGIPMDRPGTYYSEDATSMQLSCFGGRFLVKAKSAKHPETLVGEGLMGVIMAEAAKLKETVWTKSIRPTLADYAAEGSWALLSTTPEGKNWLYRQFMRGQDPASPEWWSLRLPSWSNTKLFPLGEMDPEILEMKGDMSPEKFNQEIGADFTSFVGRVFKDFTEEDNVGDFPYNPRWPLYIAMDKGFRAPSVVLFLQVDWQDNIWICGEYYRTQRTADEVGRDVLEDFKLGPMTRVAVAGYPDPASPEWAEHLGDMWNVKMRGGTGGDLETRLELIRRWLKPQPHELEDGHPEKLPKIHVDRSCTQTIRDFLDYRYPDTKEDAATTEKESPMKKDDHAPEAFGRFMVGYYGQTEIAGGSARVSKARMGGRRG